jgi:hypothetical protein
VQVHHALSPSIPHAVHKCCDGVVGAVLSSLVYTLKSPGKLAKCGHLGPNPALSGWDGLEHRLVLGF